jgi:hypothetical protein
MTTKHQKFEIQEIDRSIIKNAPYNPRKINDTQFSGLRKNLKKVGLLQPLVWNKVTGNLVSGHQRLRALDQMEKGQEYKLSVAVVELDEKTEKEQNIFFNSTTFQGEFDFDLLRELIPEIDTDAAGLDEYDLNIIGVDEDSIPDTDEDEDAFYSDVSDKKQMVKDAKKRASENIDARFEEGERYLTISFDSYRSKADFAIAIGIDEGDLFVKGDFLIKKIRDNDLQI